MSTLRVPVGDKDHIKGNPKANVSLLEYGDLECPYCGEAYPIIDNILSHLGRKIKFIYRHFPLSQSHPHAKHAAYCAEAAGEQKKFWEMHNIIYENQDALEDKDLIFYAGSLGLNINKFKKDMFSEQVKKKVSYDFMGGVKSGVNGTPTFFINGNRYNGSYQLEKLLKAIKKHI